MCDWCCRRRLRDVRCAAAPGTDKVALVTCLAIEYRITSHYDQLTAAESARATAGTKMTSVGTNGK